MSKHIIYYSAEWCEPCKTLGPIMEEIGRQIPVRKQNVDYADPLILESTNVRNVPTVILMENGQEIKRFIGMKSHAQIVNWLNE